MVEFMLITIICVVGLVVLNIRQRAVRDYYERKRDDRGYSMRNPTPLTKETHKPKVKK